MALTLKFETTGLVVKSGVSAKGNEYHMCEGYLHIPNVPYPQRFEYYASKQSEILPVGHYEADVTVSIKDNRPYFELDVRQARRISAEVRQAQPRQPAQAAS